MVSVLLRTPKACLFLSAVALIFAGCDTAQDRIARANTTSPAAAFVQVGHDHNAAMDYILGALLAESPAYREQVAESQTALEAYVLAHANTFMSARGYPTMSEAESRQAAPTRSAAAQALLDRIESAIETSENAQEVSSKIAAVEADVPSTRLSLKESNDVYTMASIARHSSAYWETSLAPWLSYYEGSANDMPMNPRMRNCWVAIAVADAVGGAIGGGVGAVRASAIAYIQNEHLGLCN